MNICVTWRSADLILEATPDAMVADLRAALSDSPDVVYVDGRAVSDDFPVSRIPNGAVLDHSLGPDAPGRTYHQGRTRFNRPPRVGTPVAPTPPTRPEPPAASERRVRFGWATVAVSVVAGAAFAAVFGPAMALFSLLGVVMAIGSWLEARWGARSERRAAQERLVRDTARYVAERVQWERKRITSLRRQMPDPAEIVTRAAHVTPTLWERRPDHADFGLVSIGIGRDAAPVGILLRRGMTVGIVGDHGMGVARWVVVQLAVHHGPADLSLEAPPGGRWDWMKWLPHHSGGLMVRISEGTPDPDSEVNLVLADTALALPGGCNIVIDVQAEGDATILRVSDGTIRHFAPLQMTETEAVTAARALARLEDPEASGSVVGAGPVRLQELLGFPSADEVVRRWHDADGLRAPIGVGQSGALEIDLDSDGPHALLAGTTGSGKSELLRSMVLSFAASLPPSRLVFVLIDYKGGSTFDRCADLPHVVGTLTDLDGISARRALEALESELREREGHLRASGAEDLGSFEGTPPIPHLLVIIDEFAVLAEQAPETLDGLIDIARRGRSLGIHLLLATQRPAGVVSDRIRANMALRIALRVHDPADSDDVIGVADAAEISRHTPGRGLCRLGPGELVGFQSAIATAPSMAAAVRVAPFRLGERPRWEGAEGTDGLIRLVETIQEAAVLAGEPVRAAIWTPELPRTVALSALPSESTSGWSAPFGLVDDARSHRILLWEGTNVLFVGTRGSAKALAALTSAVCRAHPETHVHIIGAHDPHLLMLSTVPQVGNIVTPSEIEREDRLLRYLLEMIEHRRAGRGTAHPVLLVAEDVPSNAIFGGIVSDGPGVGVFTALSTRSAGGVSGTQMAWFPERFAFDLADAYEYAALGLERTARPTAGAAVHITSGRLVRIAEPVAEAGAVPVELPEAIAALPGIVALAGFEGSAARSGSGWHIPVGLGGRSVLRPVGFRLDHGRHVVITGRRGAGKTTVLDAISAAAHGRIPVTIGERPDACADDLERLCLIDDADRLDLDLRKVPPNVHVVATATTGRIEYGHWLRSLIPDAEGLVLQPDHRDEDLWRNRLESSSTPGRGMLITGGDPIPIQVASGTMAAQHKEDSANARSNRNRRDTA